MRAAPIVVNWHNENSPVYSVHFDPHGRGRVATAGGDNNVRLWRLEANGDERKVIYLSTLIKHSQAVNVVRFSPKGEVLASAGDDGNVLLWVPSETHNAASAFGEDNMEDQETWRVKHMCRSFGSEIYDLAWSPDGVFFITGSMDNVARIYNAQTGQMVRQIAEHSHYVQGVAWDPLNEFVATQSSDRSVHIYTLKTKDGQFTLAQHNKITKMDLPGRRISSNSPAPPDLGGRTSVTGEALAALMASPLPSAPGTPTSLPLPMNPPAMTHSRRSSFGSSPSIRRSASPAPSLPLPAVMPNASPKIQNGLGVRNANLYANETFTSFFRRLSFTPEGSLLLTPAGQYKTSQPSAGEGIKSADDVINTVYIYTRAGFNKPPIAHLPGHKKPSVAVRCSPVYYTIRTVVAPATKLITVDTSCAEETMPELPEPALSTAQRIPAPSSLMDPPALPPPSTDPSGPTSSPRHSSDGGTSSGPPPAFALPYRMVYAVATQDAVMVYDTQQQTPLCIVSNLHFATFTDLSWSPDGLTLLMSSSDGFCSSVTFSPGELGELYTGAIPVISHPPHLNISSVISSTQTTPTPTPITTTMPSLMHRSTSSQGTIIPPPSPSPVSAVRPASPTRSNSTSSIATQSSHFQTSQSSSNVVTNPVPIIGSVPGVAATNSAPIPNTAFPLTTPPQTPMAGVIATGSGKDGGSVLGKRDTSESEKEEIGNKPKKRRIAPTLVPMASSSEKQA